jgi:hypothetical protein
MRGLARRLGVVPARCTATPAAKNSSTILSSTPCSPRSTAGQTLPDQRAGDSRHAVELGRHLTPLISIGAIGCRITMPGQLADMSPPGPDLARSGWA